MKKLIIKTVDGETYKGEYLKHEAGYTLINPLTLCQENSLKEEWSVCPLSNGSVTFIINNIIYFYEVNE